jgi:hypothetical protein
LRGLVEEDAGVTAELWSFSARLRVFSSDGDGTWPELGFGTLERNPRGRRGCDVSRVSPAARTTIYRLWRRRRASWRRRTRGARQRAASPDRRLKMTQWVPPVSLTEAVSWLGPKWVGFLGRGGGLRPGEHFSIFFCSVFFSFLLFSNSYLNLILFCRFSFV